METAVWFHLPSEKTSFLVSSVRIPFSLSSFIHFPHVRNLHPFPSLGVFQVTSVILMFLFHLNLRRTQEKRNLVVSDDFSVVNHWLNQTGVKRLMSVFGAEFIEHFVPICFLLILEINLFLGGFGGTAATRNTSLTVNWNILIMTDGNVVGDSGGSSNESLVLNWNGQFLL